MSICQFVKNIANVTSPSRVRDFLLNQGKKRHLNSVFHFELSLARCEGPLHACFMTIWSRDISRDEWGVFSFFCETPKQVFFREAWYYNARRECLAKTKYKIFEHMKTDRGLVS